MQRSERGFMFLFCVIFIAGLVALCTAGLTQTFIEAQAATTNIGAYQTVHLAEGGIDDALAELSTSADFTVAEGWANVTGRADCTAGTCFERTVQLLPGTQLTVTVVDALGSAPAITSTGTAGQARQALAVTVQRSSGFTVPGATTAVAEGTLAFDSIKFTASGHANTQVLDGCDQQNSASCKPGVAVTTNTLYNGMNTYATGNDVLMGDRLRGQRGDNTSISVQFPASNPNSYRQSYHYESQNLSNGGWGYARLNSLADWARAESQKPANNCYINYTNDDNPNNANNDPSNELIVQNRTFGAAGSEKVCFVEANFYKHTSGVAAGKISSEYLSDSNSSNDAEEAQWRGTISGAGILVVRGELQQTRTDRFTYTGLILQVGPTAELEFHGDTTINGAVLFATSEPGYNASGVASYHRIDFEPSGSGLIRYSSAALSKAQSLLSGWTPPNGDGLSGTARITSWRRQ